MPDNPENPKIIVDEDWKSQVERERAEQQAREAGDDDSPSAQEDATGIPPDAQLPPASFPMLVTTIVTQAMVSLGQIPESPGAEPIVRLPLAKLHIDTLEVLEEKTQGNLNADETSMLSSALHQLRMLFVHVRNQESNRPTESG